MTHEISINLMNILHAVMIYWESLCWAVWGSCFNPSSFYRLHCSYPVLLTLTIINYRPRIRKWESVELLHFLGFPLKMNYNLPRKIPKPKKHTDMYYLHKSLSPLSFPINIIRCSIHIHIYIYVYIYILFIHIYFLYSYILADVSVCVCGCF